jgi:hypothetical protein
MNPSGIVNNTMLHLKEESDETDDACPKEIAGPVAEPKAGNAKP